MMMSLVISLVLAPLVRVHILVFPIGKMTLMANLLTYRKISKLIPVVFQCRLSRLNP